MYTTLDEFLRDLPAAAAQAQERLQGQNGHFCLVTKQGRRFTLLLDNGAITLPEQDEGPFDCTVTADEKVLMDMLNGRLNPAAALLFRKVTVQGDMGKLLALAKLV